MEDATESFMPLKTRDLLTRSWQSQANLAVFLLLLILTTFVLPAVGFEKDSLSLYDRAAGSVLAVAGAAIAWENRKLFLLTSLVVIVAIAFRWATWWRPTHTLTIWSASTGLAAIIMITVVLLWQVFRAGPVTGMRIQFVPWFCLGARILHRGIGGSRRVQYCRNRCFGRHPLDQL
jgi:hypothetical protein